MNDEVVVPVAAEPAVEVAPVVDAPASVEATTVAPEPIIEPLSMQVPEAGTAQSREIEPIASEGEPTVPQVSEQSSPQPVLPAVPDTSIHTRLRTLYEKARAKLDVRKQKRLRKILALVEKNGRVTNAEVQKLLRVSDATSTRYLSELERQGRVRQVGVSGAKVVYLKI